jgi:hypothetical protein
MGIPSAQRQRSQKSQTILYTRLRGIDALDLAVHIHKRTLQLLLLLLFYAFEIHPFEHNGQFNQSHYVQSPRVPYTCMII